jgi:hypothetical protein
MKSGYGNPHLIGEVLDRLAFDANFGHRFDADVEM